MCGIWLLCGLDPDEFFHYSDAFTRIKHRGPDAWRMEMVSMMRNVYLGFHRLEIVDSFYGMQPMRLLSYPHITLLCNGELYNCLRLGEQFGFQYETKCDVECIIHLYANLGIEETLKNLDGVFSFVLIDTKKKEIHLGRDPYGVRPSFVLRTSDGIMAVSSEAKGLFPVGQMLNGKGWKVAPFLPGCYETFDVPENGCPKLKVHKRYHDIGETKPLFRTLVPWEEVSKSEVKENIRRLLTMAVKKRLMADRRIGCLLSGGLDSSLVAALLVKEAKEANLPYKIQSFSIGMGNSPDIIAARQVAEYIGTEHHEVIFSEEDVANILPQVIYTLETADITTIRASLGMYLLSHYIKNNTDSTVIFSGEGADEVAQGYIYFRDAPSAKDAHDESVRLLKDIYLFDGLRADRTTAAHSLELRLPFLDLQFSSYFLSLSPESKQPQKGVEKYLLRDAFSGTNLIPDNILWRHKEAFSDGVTPVKKSLFDIVKEIAEKVITDVDLSKCGDTYPVCTPKTKESLFYRMEFEKSYPNHCEQMMGYFWMPKWTNVADPSARFISHYAADKDNGK